MIFEDDVHLHYLKALNNCTFFFFVGFEGETSLQRWTKSENIYIKKKL